MVTDNELLSYLQQANVDSIPFSIEEISEPLMSAYMCFELAVSANSPMIKIYPNRVVWKERDCLHDFQTPIDFRPIFIQIIERDTILQIFLQSIELDNDFIVYGIGRYRDCK